MHFKQILVVKETRKNEGRVALTPQAVATLARLGYRVLIEADAGVNAGFTNAEYIDSGAAIFTFNSSGFPLDTFIVRVLRPSKEKKKLPDEKVHVWRRCPAGFHFVKEHLSHIPPSKAHPGGLVTTVHEHCAANPSHKDQLSHGEIQ